MGSILPDAKAVYVVDSEQRAMLPLISMDRGQLPVPASGTSRLPEAVKGGKLP